MKKISVIIFGLLLCGIAFALEISRIEPPNWWSGMEHDTLKILVYGDDFTGWHAKIKPKYAKLIAQNPYEDPHYYGLTLKVKKAGKVDIEFIKGNEKTGITYDIKERAPHRIMTISGSDVVYLVMPDRFSDGNKNNNYIPGHADPIRPEHKWGRRGGDLQGIIDHLDYLSELGITALWMTPVYENNYINCYHGYSPTNSYDIEPYLGDFDTYHELVDKCHRKGIKIIQDHIVNHIAPNHPLAENPPSPEWINGSADDHLNCNYRIMDITDTYGPEEIKIHPIEGWFAGYLTDMNMTNPDVVDYFIYHAIWWVETMNLDGIREDTYAYSDLKGLSKWAKEVKREYPDLFIVGEIMEFDRTRLSYYFNYGVNNYLSSVADFGFSSELYQLIVEEKPADKFYRELANDFIYRDPNMMLTFLDNHDMGRFYSAVDGEMRDYLNALTLLFGMRGVPQLYYGNEIGMPGGHDPENRDRFPGGFENMEHNAFTFKGRSEDENLIFDQVKAFTTVRKEYPEIFKSDMKHDLLNDIYMVIRQDPNSGRELLVAYNAGIKTQSASFSRISKYTHKSFIEIKKAFKGKTSVDLSAKEIIIPGKEAVMLLLK